MLFIFIYFLSSPHVFTNHTQPQDNGNNNHGQHHGNHHGNAMAHHQPHNDKHKFGVNVFAYIRGEFGVAEVCYSLTLNRIFIRS